MTPFEWIMLAMAVIGAGTTAYSSYESGQSQKKAADYNAKVAENNALIESNAAAESLKAGAAEAEAADTRKRQIIATQRASFAAGGVSSASGTPASLLAETAGLGELDALTAINNAQRRAYGYEVATTDKYAEATMARFQGKSAAKTGSLNATGSLLSSAGSIGYSAYKSGMFDKKPTKK
jgi:hypothetical protein